MARAKSRAQQPGVFTGHRAVVVGLALMAFAVPLCFAPFFYNYETPKLVMTQVLSVLLTALWLGGMALDGEVFLIDTPLYYTFLAFLAVNFISLFQAYNLFQGLDTLFRYLCDLLAVMLVFHAVRSRREIHLLAGAMALAGGLVAGIGLLQYNGIVHLYAPWDLPISTIGNVNFVAEYYNVAFPVSIALVFSLRNPWLKAGVFLSCFLMALHLVVLGSRGGWLGAGVAFLVLGGAALARHFRVGRRAVDAAFVAIVVAGLSWPVVMGLASNIRVGPGQSLEGLVAEFWNRMETRSENAIHLEDDSSQQRVLLWEDTLRLIFGRPLVGVGVGNFEYNIPRYMSRQSLEVKHRMEQKAGRKLMAFRAHNEYLEVWAETGILGFGVLCFLFYQIAGALYGLLKRYVRGQEDVFVVGLAAAFAATLVHSFFSTNLQDPASSISFWMVVGLVWSFKLNAEGEKRLGLLVTDTGGVSFGVVAAGALAFLVTGATGVQTLLGSYHHHEGSLWFKRKNFVRSGAEFARAAHYGSTNDFEIYQGLGISYYNQKRWPEAAAALRKSLQLDRNNASAYYYLGQSLGQMGKYREAVPEFREAVTLNPISGEYRLGLGKALGLAGNPNAAVRELQEAIRLDPNSADAYHALGGNERQAGDPAAAVAAYRKALALKPDDPEILNSLAVAYVQQRDFERARQIFEGLVDRWPDQPRYRVNLAVVLVNLGRPGAALVVCRDALKTAPESAGVYGAMGAAFEAMRDTVRAVAAYREGLARAPGNPAIQNRLRALQGGR